MHNAIIEDVQVDCMARDSSTSYTTKSLKRALAAAKVRKALDELHESTNSFGSDPELLKLFGEAEDALNGLLDALEAEGKKV